MTDRNELERLLAAATNDQGRLTTDGAANIGHHVFNNAHHYLSLMDGVERLRDENAYLRGKIEGNAIVRQALTEWRDQ